MSKPIFNTAGDRVERVEAGEIQIGDRVARARTHTFREIVHTEPGPTSVYLTYDRGGRDRPRKSAQWWRLVREPKALSYLANEAGERAWKEGA